MQLEQLLFFWSYNLSMSISVLFLPAVISFITSRLFKDKENLLRFSAHLIIINIILLYFQRLGVENSGDESAIWALRSVVSIILTVFFYLAVKVNRPKHALFAIGVVFIMFPVAGTII